MGDRPDLQLANASGVPVITAMSRDRIETGPGWSWTPGRVSRALAARDSNVLVARAPGRVVGFGNQAGRRTSPRITRTGHA
jgi:hypothetical protein